VLDLPLPPDPEGSLYLYYAYGGNYPETVANGLALRGNWVEAKEADCIEKCHFLWRPFNYPAETQKRLEKRATQRKSSNGPLVYNHFEVLKGLTTKSGLIRSLKQYYRVTEAARKVFIALTILSRHCWLQCIRLDADHLPANSVPRESGVGRVHLALQGHPERVCGKRADPHQALR